LLKLRNRFKSQTDDWNFTNPRSAALCFRTTIFKFGMRTYYNKKNSSENSAASAVNARGGFWFATYKGGIPARERTSPVVSPIFEGLCAWRTFTPAFSQINVNCAAGMIELFAEFRIHAADHIVPQSQTHVLGRSRVLPSKVAAPVLFDGNALIDVP
jgi:hypothetical protein